MTNTVPHKTERKISLTEKVISSLRTEIESGNLMPGAKLPTEPVLTKHFGVSRTVLREAIAVLKADGLLEPRQGAGVFVLAPVPPENDGSVFDVNATQMSDVLEILELRMAVEIEAAGLACSRSSAAQQAKIYEAVRDMERQVQSGKQAAQADYEFHRAIADATNNRRYVTFMDYLGDKTIPRAQAQPHQRPIAIEQQLAHTDRILAEHHRIYEAITLRDADGARIAMRDHLLKSQARYQSLLRNR
ncbi:FadR/GntR family transcriptional regulator [Thalassospira sp. TSL5-1]|uniref:FadR/GntR family transcriptional regulator n=1 Tax=Thalassospira sp. TSL5-1 TaxID=1544451 RepID=UPI00093FE2EF|nr:FadR/GntR family transcriptional regulator [Thalassospira sp. TSL5-1]OKH86742.1 GntR family transcriptional regulator [Thalassospira sp. TSL5-1]